VVEEDTMVMDKTCCQKDTRNVSIPKYPNFGIYSIALFIIPFIGYFLFSPFTWNILFMALPENMFIKFRIIMFACFVLLSCIGLVLGCNGLRKAENEINRLNLNKEEAFTRGTIYPIIGIVLHTISIAVSIYFLAGYYAMLARPFSLFQT